MAKKLKKAKKGMSPEAKFTLASSFKGLISNQAVIDGSRSSPWWVAAIFLAFSTVLPLLPTFSQLSKMNGASFLQGWNYGLDQQLAHFAYTQKVNGYEFKVEGGKLFSYTDGIKDETQRFVNPVADPEYFLDAYRKYEYAVIDEYTNQFAAKFYFWVDENLASNVNRIIQQTYLVNGNHGSEGRDIPTGAEGEETYLPNIVIFTPTTMAVAMYKDKTTTAAGATFGGLDWLHTAEDKGLIERMIGEFADEVTSPELAKEKAFVHKHSQAVLEAFSYICTETYLTQKNKTKWANTGIYFAIYVGVVLFLGLMVFILTRGKNNPYKFLNIWECQKISWWGAASPAIIGTILSLIFSGNAIGQMAFLLVVSLRIMWLSMKQLRPVIQ